MKTKRRVFKKGVTETYKIMGLIIVACLPSLVPVILSYVTGNHVWYGTLFVTIPFGGGLLGVLLEKFGGFEK